MRYTSRAFAYTFLIFAALLLPVYAFGDEAVEKAVNLARELSEKSGPEQKTDAVLEGISQGSGEPECAPPDQATYPGLANMRIERGGNGQPSISIYYPAVGVPAVDADLKKFAEDQASFYESELKDFYGEDAEKPDSYGAWEETGFFTAERPNPDILSVTFNIYSYTGGAHGQMLVETRNYDLKKGERLRFADLFANPEKAVAILSETTAAKLRASLGEDVEEDMLREGTSPEQANFANLSLLPGGVAVEFQPYQVGPWSIGQQHVEVGLDELAPAGPNPAVWPKKPAN